VQPCTLIIAPIFGTAQPGLQVFIVLPAQNVIAQYLALPNRGSKFLLCFRHRIPMCIRALYQCRGTVPISWYFQFQCAMSCTVPMSWYCTNIVVLSIPMCNVVHCTNVVVLLFIMQQYADCDSSFHYATVCRLCFFFSSCILYWCWRSLNLPELVTANVPSVIRSDNLISCIPYYCLFYSCSSLI